MRRGLDVHGARGLCDDPRKKERKKEGRFWTWRLCLSRDHLGRMHMHMRACVCVWIWDVWGQAGPREYRTEDPGPSVVDDPNTEQKKKKSV